jgi:hypothetical protein
VHEYFVENIIQLFENVKESSDELIKLVEKTNETSMHMRSQQGYEYIMGVP